MFSAFRQLHRRLRFRRLHKPEVARRFRLLGTDYGGWPVIPVLLPMRPLVYSFGVGEDISFDRAVIADYDAEVHAFDPTPRSGEWIGGQQLPEGFSFHSIGIGARDEEVAFFPPADSGHVSFSNAPAASQTAEPVLAAVRRLSSIMAQLSHDRIDVLKMDVEGFEYEVIPDFLAAGIRPRLVLIEFHHNMYQATEADTIAAVGRLHAAGYSLFYVSASGHEYGFTLDADETPVR